MYLHTFARYTHTFGIDQLRATYIYHIQLYELYQFRFDIYFRYTTKRQFDRQFNELLHVWAKYSLEGTNSYRLF